MCMYSNWASVLHTTVGGWERKTFRCWVCSASEFYCTVYYCSRRSSCTSGSCGAGDLSDRSDLTGRKNWCAVGREKISFFSGTRMRLNFFLLFLKEREEKPKHVSSDPFMISLKDQESFFFPPEKRWSFWCCCLREGKGGGKEGRREGGKKISHYNSWHSSKSRLVCVEVVWAANNIKDIFSYTTPRWSLKSPIIFFL